MLSHVEMIKPSSPPPHHLREFKLSFLDQLAPPLYIPLIFFYQSGHLHRESLKASLAKVLSEFYPLAGRFSREKSFTIDCNDSGAMFVESKVEKNLLEVIEDPKMEELEKYLPLGPTGSTGAGGMGEAIAVLLAVQITLFDCGGMALAVQIHHNLADGVSMVNFMNAWAAANRGRDIISPKFGLASLFPPRDISSFSNSFGIITTEKIVTKRLVFDKKEIQKLKLGSSQVIKDHPTRVEAISSYIWRRFNDVARSKGSKKLVGVSQAVNLRPRMDPPLPSHAFGNMARPAVAVPTLFHDNEGDLVGVLRDAVRKVDGDYVRQLQNGGGEHLNSLKNLREIVLKGEMEVIMFSSWFRFPVYEVEFGWGRPIWVSTATLPFKNFMVFMSSSCGEGMEVWVNMVEKDAASLDFHFSN